MATPAAGGASGAGRNSRTDLLQAIGTLNSLFGGGASKVKTSQTVTEGKQVSPEALQSMIRTMQSQANGLASVLQPQRSAGLYGSNVNQLLAQQFAENVAGKAAEISAPTVRTNSQTQATAPETSPLAKALAGLGAAAQIYSMGKGILGTPAGKAAAGAGAGALGGGTLAQIYGVQIQDSMGDLTRLSSDWIANTPGKEAADFLTAEGFGDIGMSLSQLASPTAATGADIFSQNFIGGGSNFEPVSLGGITELLGSFGGNIGSTVSDIGSSIGGGFSDALSSIGDWFKGWF